jgi:hypothetical protein
MMRFENEDDLQRETKAIKKFVDLFNGTYKKLDPNDIDFKIFNKDNEVIAYAEVKGRNKLMSVAFPLPVSIRKLLKLADKRLNPVMIWACEDGIIYAKIKDLIGDIRWGGRKPREGAYNDSELMAYFDKDKTPFKFIPY